MKRKALIHDWLTVEGGAEKVLTSLVELFPSDIYTLVKSPKCVERLSLNMEHIYTSFIQKLPFAKRKYHLYLPLFPMAIEQFDLSNYDIIISSSHSVAKGVLTHSEQLHICYCHTPMRYAWDLYQHYLRASKLNRGIKGVCAKTFLHYLRMWDLLSSSRVDAYIANSRYVARRIFKAYQRRSEVLYPPVDVNFFTLEESKEKFYLAASRFVPYKKIDLIVEAFGTMPDKRLIVIGDGPEKSRIKRKAKKNVEILGYQSDEILRNHLQRARGFVFAALEDFGILPLEAQACGTPVIAFGKGGTLESVSEGQSGIFFREQTVDSIVTAVHDFEKREFDAKLIRTHAKKFRKERFKKAFKTLVDEKYKSFMERQ